MQGSPRARPRRTGPLDGGVARDRRRAPPLQRRAGEHRLVRRRTGVRAGEGIGGDRGAAASVGGGEVPGAGRGRLDDGPRTNAGVESDELAGARRRGLGEAGGVPARVREVVGRVGHGWELMKDDFTKCKDATGADRASGRGVRPPAIQRRGGLRPCDSAASEPDLPPAKKPSRPKASSRRSSQLFSALRTR